VLSTRTLATSLALLIVGLAATAERAPAQSLEGVLMPGKVIEGHAKLEGECTNCHVRFDRAAQDRLCLDCHKEVAEDVRKKQGYHGRIKERTCRGCHTEHKGRDAKIAPLDEKKFDHTLTDFALRGAHANPKVECRSCHAAKVKYRDAQTACVSCHKKDDVHKGSLGPACADCHGENNWKEAKFDHDKTKFPLVGKHRPVPCKDCHRDGVYKETPLACIACHKKDDKHKARFGEKCESCHSARDWSDLLFNHDTDTKYPLRGKHRQVKCESCHTGHLYRDKLQSACIACHKKDDKHQGTLGTACGDCHNERNWKDTRFDHSKTRFPLRGKHDEIECKDCHKSAVFKDAPMACVACHRKDDKHKGSLGEACGDCHTERNWKESKFDHDKTRFPLLGKHRAAKCEDCHKDPNFKQTPSTCYACHKKDDKHEGQLGQKCEQCHGEQDWKKTSFDHGRTKFPLLGKHQIVECNKCHATPRYKDAKTECLACHDKDDKHKGRLGPECETCHNARDWKIWDFNHDTKTRFKLDGGHKGLDCHVCHRTRVAKKPSLPMTCVSCHASDDVHDGSFGKQCEKCHVSASWKQIKQRLGAPPWTPWGLLAHTCGTARHSMNGAEEFCGGGGGRGSAEAR